MKWIRENFGKVCIVAAVVFFLVTASLSSVRTVDDGTNDTGAERAAQRLTADVHAPFSAVFNNIGDFFSDIIHVREYASENEKLKKENARLKESLSDAELDEKQLSELKDLSKSLNYASYSKSYSKTSADVISLNQSGVFGIMTISAGSNDGVRKGNLVINEDGLVGRVMSVTGSSAKVEGIVDSTMSVSFYVKDKDDTLGIVTGDGKGGLEGYLFDSEKDLSKKAVLMTSGLGRYPAGIEIGTVKKVTKDKSTGQINFTAEPSVDFYAADIVSVLTANKGK